MSLHIVRDDFDDDIELNRPPCRVDWVTVALFFASLTMFLLTVRGAVDVSFWIYHLITG